MILLNFGRAEGVSIIFGISSNFIELLVNWLKLDRYLGSNDWSDFFIELKRNLGPNSWSQLFIELCAHFLAHYHPNLIDGGDTRSQLINSL